jgi:ABC-type nickel/cobalt efflux system permease component RcnA
MLALTLGQAKTIAVLVVIVLIGLAIASAWVMKEVTQKIALVVILGLLALLVWTQRASLQECSEKVRAAGTNFNDPDVDTTCSFLGRDVQIKRNTDS